MPSQGVTNVANAIINKINNLISSHNNNSNAHQDIRESIPSATSELNNNSGFITSSSVPSASSATPLSDTQNGGVGTGTTWARSDHTHPKSSLYEDNANKVTSLSSSSTDTQYPSAKAVYDATLNLDTLDCINENFTLLSLPQIILTYNEDEFDAIEVALLRNYPKGAYVDWGDGTSIETYVGNDILEHDYLDNIQEHTIIIYGDILNDILSSYSFYDITGITSINIPSSVKSLGSNCFNNCTGLTSVTIPSSVTSLNNSCFSGCTGLTSVVIPSSVISLGDNCFSGCTNLVDYQLYWETPPITWNSNLMPNNTDTYFTIPNGTTANYTAKGFPSDKLVERSE